MVKKTYYIKGMHCAGCETFIARSVRQLDGVNDVSVSLAQSSIHIEAESQKAIPSIDRLNRRFQKHGYTFSEQQYKTAFKPGKYAAVFGLFLMIILLFFLLERSSLLNFLYVDSSSLFWAYFLFGIAAGFSSCAALVGSLLLSAQESWAANREDGRALPFFLFNSARIVTFTVLGGLLGVLGSTLQFSLEATAVLTVLIAVFIIIVGLQMLGVPFFRGISLNFSGRWINRFSKKPDLHYKVMPILVGGITFFVPCGFTLIAQAGALRAGNFMDGMLILLAFALGTLPVLLIISYSSIKLHQNPKLSTSFRLLSGLLIVFFAGYTIIAQIKILNPSNLARNQAPGLTAPAETVYTDDQQQIMQMEARGFEYLPELITIKAYLPTRFEIMSNNSLGCANAVYARGLYPDVILLSPGLNVVEFTAPAPGTYQISCSMWMVNPITVVVE